LPHADEETIELDGQPVFFRRAGDDAVPILYLHVLPPSSKTAVQLSALVGSP